LKVSDQFECEFILLNGEFLQLFFSKNISIRKGLSGSELNCNVHFLSQHFLHHSLHTSLRTRFIDCSKFLKSQYRFLTFLFICYFIVLFFFILRNVPKTLGWNLKGNFENFRSCWSKFLALWSSFVRELVIGRLQMQTILESSVKTISQTVDDRHVD
jgi:hypothetical protein